MRSPGQIRAVALAAAALAASGCQGPSGSRDEDLGGLVVSAQHDDKPIEPAALLTPDGLGQALRRPAHRDAALLGGYVATFHTETTVSEGATVVEQLTDDTVIEAGKGGDYHALANNSADYGREVTFLAGRLFLRPRYAVWHGRAPNDPDEPGAVLDQLAQAPWADWDLVAPAAVITDGGATTLEGRPGKVLQLARRSGTVTMPDEPLVQRAWRQARTVDGLDGSVTLDAATAMPLAMNLTATVGFTRDGRHFTMKVVLTYARSKLGAEPTITAPPPDQVVATPERLKEVDDRDALLEGIAPPARNKAPSSVTAPDPDTTTATKPTPAPAETPAP